MALAVAPLAQRAAVWPPHTHRMLARLGEGRFVDDPDLRFTEEINDFVGQAPLDLRDFPRTLAHELAQGLNISSLYAAGHGLNRFALPVQQQALQVDARPVAALAASHGLDQVFQEVLQATIQCFQGLRCHGVTVPDTARTFKRYLT